jgi:hypothetical protein
MSVLTLSALVEYLTEKSDNEPVPELALPNEPVLYNEPALPNEPVLSNADSYLYSICTEKAIRIDIVPTKIVNKKTYNISLYSSILYCIDDHYQDLYDVDQLDSIDNMIIKICLDINNNQILRKYKLKIKKNDLLSAIKNYANNEMVITFLSHYYDINIYIVSYENKKVYCAYPFLFNKNKKSIILVNYSEKFYAPITTMDNKYFEGANQLFKTQIVKFDNAILNINQ